MDICAVLLYKTFGIPIRSALILNEDMMKFFVRLLLSSSLLLALAGCAFAALGKRPHPAGETLPEAFDCRYSRKAADAADL